MSRAAAERGYSVLRDRALAATQARLVANGIVAELRPIDARALDAFASHWQGCPDRRLRWPWPDMRARFHRDYPARFELSAWSGNTLCCLALGRPSASSLHCGLHYLEGNPDPQHPLRGRVAALAITALQDYTVALGKREMRLVEPLPALVPYYQRFGFRLVTPKREAQYLTREALP